MSRITTRAHRGHNPSPDQTGRRSGALSNWAKRGGLVAISLTVAVTTAACGSSDSTGASSGSQAATTKVVADMKASIEKYRKPSNTFVAPGDKLDANKLPKSGEFWYVSLSQEIPVLSIEQDALKQAAAALGMKVNICDSKFQPAVAAACVNSAIDAKATGIFTDSIATESIGTAVTNAEKAGVPIVAMSAIGTNTKGVTYHSNGDQLSHAVTAQWVIADSKGKAQVLQTKVQDDPGAIDDITSGSAPEFNKCNGCKVTHVSYTAQTVPSVPSVVSSGLLRNPNINYGFPQFDFLVPLFKSGVQTAGYANKMKVVSTNAVLSDMKLVKSGDQAADAGSNRNYSGWNAMDSMLRMLQGMPVSDKSTVPVRVFDKTNIGSVTLTVDAAESGEWFGPLTYQKDFVTLWGLS
jgi:ribose transport system substrate-binding protein